MDDRGSYSGKHNEGIYFLRHRIQTGSGAQTWMKLFTHLHPVWRLRIRGAIPPLP